MLFFLPLFVTALIAALAQLVAHLFVQRFFPRLEYIPRYVIGTLCALAPVTAQRLVEGDVDGPIVIWACVGASGLAVWGIRTYEKRQAALLRDRLELERLRLITGGSLSDAKKILGSITHASTEQDD